MNTEAIRGKTRVFVVENDFVLSETLELLLDKWGFEFAGIATNAADAIDKIQSLNVDLALIDIHLDGMQTGIAVGNYIRNNLSIPFIFMSGTNDEQTIALAKAANPAAYLVKPFAWEHLSSTLYIVSNTLK